MTLSGSHVCAACMMRCTPTQPVTSTNDSYLHVQYIHRRCYLQVNFIRTASHQQSICTISFFHHSSAQPRRSPRPIRPLLIIALRFCLGESLPWANRVARAFPSISAPSTVLVAKAQSFKMHMTNGNCLRNANPICNRLAHHRGHTRARCNSIVEGRITN